MELKVKTRVIQITSSNMGMFFDGLMLINNSAQIYYYTLAYAEQTIVYYSVNALWFFLTQIAVLIAKEYKMTVLAFTTVNK